MRILIGGPVAECDREQIPRFMKQGHFFDCPERVSLTISLVTDSCLDAQYPTRLERIVAGREKLRRQAIEGEYDAIVFLDADMEYSCDLLPALVHEHEKGFDVVYNVYRLKNGCFTYNGFGGTLLSRPVFTTIPFRCYINPETRNEVDEGFLFEMDVLNAGFTISRGVFGATRHHEHFTEKRVMTPWEKIRYSYPARKVMAIAARNTTTAERISRLGYRRMGEV